MTGILPPNATALERALADAGARLSDVPVVVRELWNPDACPAAHLPWLAWASTPKRTQTSYPSTRSDAGAAAQVTRVSKAEVVTLTGSGGREVAAATPSRTRILDM